MLEALRLNTEDLHELAKQAIERSWQAARAARYRARDMNLGRDVALKLLTRSLTILNVLPDSVANPKFSPP